MKSASLMFSLILMAFMIFLPPGSSSFAAAPKAGEAASPPARALAQLGESIDRADLAAFERQVDLDAILDQALTLVMQALAKPENAAQMPPLLALVFSQSSGDGGAAVRQLLKGEAQAFIRHGVASGAFAGRKPTSAPSGLLAPLFADASLGRKEIRQAGTARRDGKDWLLPFVIHDGGNGNDYPVLGRFSQSGDGFRLTAIENLGELLERISRESMNSMSFFSIIIRNC